MARPGAEVPEDSSKEAPAAPVWARGSVDARKVAWPSLLGLDSEEEDADEVTPSAEKLDDTGGSGDSGDESEKRPASPGDWCKRIEKRCADACAKVGPSSRSSLDIAVKAMERLSSDNKTAGCGGPPGDALMPTVKR